MAQALSNDLRRRVVAAVMEGGMSRRGAAQRYGIAPSTAIKWVDAWQRTGSYRPGRQGGDRRSQRIEARAAAVLALIEETPDMTLAEIAAHLEDAHGLRVSQSTVWRFFHRRGVTFKKNRACQRAAAPRRAATPTGLQPGDDPAFAVPRTGGVVEGGEAPHLFGAGLGAAHLEVVGDAVCEAVQHGIARQAEDVVDAVLLAPRHGLGPAVVAVPPECEPGARPVPADAPHQVLEEDADLGARRRLAGAQENRHRLAALDMVDVHRQEAPRVCARLTGASAAGESPAGRRR